MSYYREIGSARKGVSAIAFKFHWVKLVASIITNYKHFLLNEWQKAHSAIQRKFSIFWSYRVNFLFCFPESNFTHICSQYLFEILTAHPTITEFRTEILSKLQLYCWNNWRSSSFPHKKYILFERKYAQVLGSRALRENRIYKIYPSSRIHLCISIFSKFSIQHLLCLFLCSLIPPRRVVLRWKTTKKEDIHLNST